MGTSTQHRYQNVLKEETLRHQVNAQSLRVQALKESWEHVFEMAASATASSGDKGGKGEGDVLGDWQRRLRKEQQAWDAHKVQSELLHVRTPSPRPPCECV